jgi:riboflavin synthase
LEAKGESWNYAVELPEKFTSNVVPKGSITIDGISLTVASQYLFPKPTIVIAVIPYTYDHTNIRDRKPGDAVNLEGDILGKYVDRYLAARTFATAEAPSALNVASLTEQGF